MGLIDYGRIHNIEISAMDMLYVYNVIEPRTFLRLYTKEDTSKKESLDKQRKEKSLYEINKELTEALQKEAARSKDLISLTLIYRAFKATKYINNTCKVQLNELLAFELYISLSCRINLLRRSAVEIEKKLEKIDDYAEEAELNRESADIFKEIEALSAINKRIVDSITAEMLFELTRDYDKMDSITHAKRCLI